MIENWYWSSCKVPSILVRIQGKRNFMDRFSKNAQILFMKILLVGVEFLYVARRTNGHDEANICSSAIFRKRLIRNNFLCIGVTTVAHNS
jgi:hypothetical protein